MTDAEIIQYVYAHTGGEKQSGLIKPYILAMAELSYRDTAIKVVKESPELAKKLQTLASNSYTGGKFTVPSDMLYFEEQKFITDLRIDSAQAFQVADKRKFNLLTSTISNHYYAVDGRDVIIRKSDGTSSGSYSFEYYKIPVNSDIDDDLRNVFLECLLSRLGFASTQIFGKPNDQK